MKKDKRQFKHKRVRKSVVGTSERPRLAVFRSGQHIYAQIIDDSLGKTLVASSDLGFKEGTKVNKAKLVGGEVAKAALKKSIKKVVFDRGGFEYHGRVAALAEAVREEGLEF